MKEIICSVASIGVWKRIFIIVASYALFGNLAALAQLQSDLSIEIVPQHDTSGKFFLPHQEQFQVVLSNHSAHAVRVWDNLCEFGHRELSFRTKTQDEEVKNVEHRSINGNDWTNFPPKTVEVAAGGAYSFKVSLSDFFWGERAWVNVPEPNTGQEIEIAAVFEIKPTKNQSAQNVWSGRIESTPLKVLILNPKLKTPQNYLWNACPRQALNLLKSDPSWITNMDPEDKCTPLHHAARFGYNDVVIWLIQHGANVNAAAYNEFTPLHLTERKDTAELLIKAGANLNQKDVWGKTPLQMAAEYNRHEIVNTILNSNHKLDLYTAILLKKRDAAIKMLVHDPDIIVGGEGGSDLGGNTTPLGEAAGQGDLELVKLLLEAGAPINDPTDCVRYGGYATPLCNAVWRGKTDIVEFLLKKGAATNVVGGKFYNSITEFAEKNSSKRIVELLKEYKGNRSLDQGWVVEKKRNKLPSRIASGDFKLPDEVKTK